MAWIRVLGEGEADEKLSAAFAKVVGNRGKLSHIMAVHSLCPEAMTAHMDLYMSVMYGRSGLSREEREIVAVVVSAVNGCPYCVAHHGEALDHYWKDRDRVAQLGQDPGSADLAPRARALVEYAVRLTTRPAEMGEADVGVLRDHGLDDADILTLNLIASYFNFVNRIALGLGVAFDPEETAGYKY